MVTSGFAWKDSNKKLLPFYLVSKQCPPLQVRVELSVQVNMIKWPVPNGN